MATLVYSSTTGSNDPTRATLPYILANGAVEAGHSAEVFLTGEAVYLMKDEVANAVVPMGWPAFNEHFQKAVASGVTTFV